MRELYIVGAGGFGRELAWLVERINEVSLEWDVKGFVDDDESTHGRMIDGYRVIGSSQELAAIDHEVWAVCAIGSAVTRKAVIARLNNYGNIRFATLVDPYVQISGLVRIGEGSIVCAGTIITVDVEIRKHVIINLNCTIGHDCVIEDYVTIYPNVNVSGNCVIKKCVELGTGVQVLQGKHVAPCTVIGAGAVITEDVTECGTYVGVPAKRIK